MGGTKQRGELRRAGGWDDAGKKIVLQASRARAGVHLEHNRVIPCAIFHNVVDSGCIDSLQSYIPTSELPSGSRGPTGIVPEIPECEKIITRYHITSTATKISP